MNTNIYSVLHDEHVNPWYILTETGTEDALLLTLYGNCDKPNCQRSYHGPIKSLYIYFFAHKILHFLLLKY